MSEENYLVTMKSIQENILDFVSNEFNEEENFQ